MYMTKVYDGVTLSTQKLWDLIYHNFIIANYNSQEAIDNDDGSCYYKSYENFFVYGQNGLKTDYGGHDIVHYNNIYAYISSECFGLITEQLNGHRDYYYNNTCVMHQNSPTNYGTWDCATQSNQNEWIQLGNNKIYQMQESGYSTGLCGQNETTFQQNYPGIDDGTVIYGPPNNTMLFEMARNYLFG